MQGAHRYFKRNVSKVIEASKRFGRVYKPRPALGSAWHCNQRIWSKLYSITVSFLFDNCNDTHICHSHNPRHNVMSFQVNH